MTSVAVRIARAVLAGAATIAVAGAVSAADKPKPIVVPVAPVVVGVPAHVEVGIGAAGWSGGPDGLLEVAGRIVIPHAAPWKLEIEGAGQAIFWDSKGGNEIVGAYAHLYHATSGGGAIGLFGGLLSNDGLDGVVGVEGRWAVGPTSVVLAQLNGVFQFDGGSSALHLRGEWWHYANANHKWGIYGDLLDFGCCTASWEVGLAGEMRLAGKPMSVYGRASFASFYGTSGWLAVAGMRFFTDGPTLRQSDDNVPFAVRFHPSIFD